MDLNFKYFEQLIKNDNFIGSNPMKIKVKRRLEMFLLSFSFFFFFFNKRIYSIHELQINKIKNM